jgi:hypothetical protein
VCLAVAYDKLGRRPEADATIQQLRESDGERASYQFSEIYAQRGELGHALEWLDGAVRVSDTGLHYMKVDPLVDPRRATLQSAARAREVPELTRLDRVFGAPPRGGCGITQIIFEIAACDRTCECWGHLGIFEDTRPPPTRRPFTTLSHGINVLTPILGPYVS